MCLINAHQIVTNQIFIVEMCETYTLFCHRGQRIEIANLSITPIIFRFTHNYFN